MATLIKTTTTAMINVIWCYDDISWATGRESGM